jgi:hypothetical protein
VLLSSFTFKKKEKVGAKLPNLLCIPRVIRVKTGIQIFQSLDSRLRGSDGPSPRPNVMTFEPFPKKY